MNIHIIFYNLAQSGQTTKLRFISICQTMPIGDNPFPTKGMYGIEFEE